MLRNYCFENEKIWDEGIPLVLFAARDSVQESLGFSPFELVFGHQVRGPLKLLKEKWLNGDKLESENLLDFVSKFRNRTRDRRLTIIQTKELMIISRKLTNPSSLVN
jgi:hypothetical protein